MWRLVPAAWTTTMSPSAATWSMSQRMSANAARSHRGGGVERGRAAPAGRGWLGAGLPVDRVGVDDRLEVGQVAVGHDGEDALAQRPGADRTRLGG